MKIRSWIQRLTAQKYDILNARYWEFLSGCTSEKLFSFFTVYCFFSIKTILSTKVTSIYARYAPILWLRDIKIISNAVRNTVKMFDCIKIFYRSLLFLDRNCWRFFSWIDIHSLFQVKKWLFNHSGQVHQVGRLIGRGLLFP